MDCSDKCGNTMQHVKFVVLPYVRALVPSHPAVPHSVQMRRVLLAPGIGAFIGFSEIFSDISTFQTDYVQARLLSDCSYLILAFQP